MKIVFMGTPDFASGCLEALLKCGHEICGVFCQPDRPKGRGHKLCPPPVKQLAESRGIPVFQPEKIRDPGVLDTLKALNPELIVVVAYGRILPESILELPKFGCINVHGSLLPALRGSAPIQWAVINGLKRTGVTVMKMDKGMDTGDILSSSSVEIGESTTSGELFEILCREGARLLCDTITRYASGEIVPVKQDDSLASAAPMLTKEMSLIDWSRPAYEIHNLIRGLSPWPVAVTHYGETRLRLYSSRALDGEFSGESGTVLENDGQLVVKCGGISAVEITELQKDGSKRMGAAEFLRGCPIQKGSVLS